MRWCIPFSEVSHIADMDMCIYVENVWPAHEDISLYDTDLVCGDIPLPE